MGNEKRGARSPSTQANWRGREVLMQDSVRSFIDDFQSVLHTLESLFAFFCFASC